MRYKILIVDDEDGIREMLHRAILSWSYDADYASGPSQALCLMKINNYDIIVTDKNMPGKEGIPEAGMYVLKQAKKLLPAAEVIMMTGYASMDTILEAMRHGAFEYIQKPFPIEELKEIIDKIIDYKKFSNSALAIRVYREIFNEILNLAQTNYSADDKELHTKLKFILNKFYTFFKIQKENEQVLKNIYANAEKLKECILRTDPNYQLVLNISQELSQLNKMQ